jgi:hypothetical protein
MQRHHSLREASRDPWALGVQELICAFRIH